ncbi:MAG: DUF2851 family protein [Bacteroidaceae bacterium]|nr:DUF2851 family protein [Bacteroidaceae bacterium]
MELLLHFTWQQRLLPLGSLLTTDGRPIEVIDPGLHNTNAGPDFFNAKVRIDGTLWVGNVEVHERSSDWYKHHHEANDANYGNVILHIVGEADCSVSVAGKELPQVVLPVPKAIADNYATLMREEHFPPCHRVIPQISSIEKNSWLTALTVERLQEKTERIEGYLKESCNDWEQAFFIALARNFGFGVNAEPFELWAKSLPLQVVGKHRDDAFQVEALFYGQAGLLDENLIKEERRDAHLERLRKEYAFLRHKFNLTPINGALWKLLRMRPQNFPHVRLAQLLHLFQTKRINFSQLLGAQGKDEIMELLEAHTEGYWQTHYTFGAAHETPSEKHLQRNSLQLLLINTVAPLLFCYGKYHNEEALCERALDLLDELKAESNFITRAWGEIGLKATNASQSQALIQLKRNYCERKDCLRCRFGRHFLKTCTDPSPTR